MNIPITNPQINLDLNDKSTIDESIKQDGLTITAGAGSVINTASGNGKTQKMGVSALFQVLAVSIICDIMICGIMVFSNNLSYDRVENRIEKVETSTQQNINVLKEDVINAVSEMKNVANDVTASSKDGIIWILRRDIINSIEYHEARGDISSKQYKRIKDQFDYYVSIGGNHNVHEKMDEFNTKIFGTQEIKMTK